MTEKLGQQGENIPDPTLVDYSENLEIEERRKELAQLPEYPSEWQDGHTEDTSKGFDDQQLKVNVSLKENEMKKLIKKYKRYLKSNITEVKRLES